MPSEGRPQSIDTAVLATPDDVPTADLWLMVERRERHASRVTGPEENAAGTADVLAALALGTAIRRVLDEQEQQLVREGLRNGATWKQLAGARGVADADQVRGEFVAWARRLPGDGGAEALRLAGGGEGR